MTKIRGEGMAPAHGCEIPPNFSVSSKDIASRYRITNQVHSWEMYVEANG